MTERRGSSASREIARASRAILWMILSAMAAACGRADSPAVTNSSPVTLRDRRGEYLVWESAGRTSAGRRQSIIRRSGPIRTRRTSSSVAGEGLDSRDRRPVHELWNYGRMRSSTTELPPMPATVTQALRNALPGFMGPVFEDVDRIEPSPNGNEIRITFKRPSPFLLESLGGTHPQTRKRRRSERDRSSPSGARRAMSCVRTATTISADRSSTASS